MINILATAPAQGGSFQSLIFLGALFVVFYFFLIRPEKKRKKQLEDMRSAITVGDEIVTIGGIMGKVVQATEETITFETGEDRVRLEVTKWAISVNVREEQKKAQQNKNTEGKKKAKTSGEDNSVEGQQ